MKVSVADAKNRLPELIKAAEEGESVTICRRGKPVVDLVRTNVPNEGKREFGIFKDKIIELCTINRSLYNSNGNVTVESQAGRILYWIPLSSGRTSTARSPAKARPYLRMMVRPSLLDSSKKTS